MTPSERQGNDEAQSSDAAFSHGVLSTGRAIETDPCARAPAGPLQAVAHGRNRTLRGHRPKVQFHPILGGVPERRERALGLAVRGCLCATTLSRMRSWDEAARAMRIGCCERPDGTIACERCVVADTAPSRMRGLLGRSGLDAGGGTSHPADQLGAHVLHAIRDRRRVPRSRARGSEGRRGIAPVASGRLPGCPRGARAAGRHCGAPGHHRRRTLDVGARSVADASVRLLRPVRVLVAGDDSEVVGHAARRAAAPRVPCDVHDAPVARRRARRARARQRRDPRDVRRPVGGCRRRRPRSRRCRSASGSCSPGRGAGPP